MKLYTIGHSNHSLDRFVQLLESAGVMMVVDVRTSPASRYNSQFNRNNLEQTLPPHLLGYAYAGKYLGGRPSDPTCYKRREMPPEGADYLHEVDYPQVMERPWFRQAIARLLEIADQQTTAVMCSEEDPAHCHRHHLIARYLMRAHPDVEVRHIRGDGNVIPAHSIVGSVEDEAGRQMPLL